MNVIVNKIFDKLGICASAICLVHCLLTPFVVLFFPTIEESLGENAEKIHTLLAFVVVTLVVIAILPKFLKHRRKDILSYASLGISLILGALIFEEPPILHNSMTILGSIFLIITHIKNMKAQQNKVAY